MKYFIIISMLSLAGCTSSLNKSLANQDPASSLKPTASQLSQGKKYFNFRCAGCHELNSEAPSSFGPHLEGIIGREAGVLSDYDYSKALLNADFIWTESVMDGWLADPRSLLPGMCLTFKGIPDADIRRAIILYMKTPQSS